MRLAKANSVTATLACACLFVCSVGVVGQQVGPKNSDPKALSSAPGPVIPSSGTEPPASSPAVPASNVGAPVSGEGAPASNVGIPESNVGVPASNVGVPASNVGTPVMDALPAQYTDEQMTYHVAGNTVDVDTDIKITSPNAETRWASNTTNTVQWTGTRPSIFSFQLINDDPHIRATGISLRASVSTSEGSATCDVPRLPSGSGWYVRFYDQLNISRTIAVSEKFSITGTSLSTAAGATTDGLVSSNVTQDSASSAGIYSTSGIESNRTTSTKGTIAGHNGVSNLPLAEWPWNAGTAVAFVFLVHFVLI